MFEKYQAKIYGISVDEVESHKKFAEKLNLTFPLLSDTNPVGELSKKFNVFNEKTQLSKRAIFVLDADGRVRWSQIVPDTINPGADGILNALEELSNGNGKF